MEPVAATKGARVVVLGQGSQESAARFLRHFPLKELYTSDDAAAFEALQLYRGEVLDFVNPMAVFSGVTSAARALARPGVISAKFDQGLPDANADIRQMGGQFLLGPGERCDFAHIERMAGASLPKAELLRKLAWV